MPIRHGGMFANRASTWPRDDFRQHNRAALIKANNVERVLADIDADYGDALIIIREWRLPPWLRLISHLRNNFHRVTTSSALADQSAFFIVRNRVYAIEMPHLVLGG